MNKWLWLQKRANAINGQTPGKDGLMKNGEKTIKRKGERALEEATKTKRLSHKSLSVANKPWHKQKHKQTK